MSSFKGANILFKNISAFIFSFSLLFFNISNSLSSLSFISVSEFIYSLIWLFRVIKKSLSKSTESFNFMGILQS